VSFEIGWVKWLAPLVTVALAVVFAVDYTYRRHVLERVGHLPQLERMTASLSWRRRALKAVLLTVALTLCVAALARPQVEGDTTWRQRGIDLVVVMDFSKSMLARDVYPSRLERMREEVESLLDEIESDRVAIVTFAGAAAHFPLTHDTEAARSLFRGLSPMDMPPGSDIGEAILVARCIARPDLTAEPGCARIGGRGRGGAPLDEPGEAPRPAEPEIADRARAIVVFTDGGDTEGRARAELAEAVRLGVHVYLVGVGTTTGELIPELDLDGNEIGWMKTADGQSFVTTRLEQDELLELAELAGGPAHYIQLDPERLRAAELIARLEHLEKGDLDERVIKHPREIYQFLLFPALLLLLLELCISERRRRVIYPETQP
jgi:Ca-activated chloride channel homolog